MRLLIVILLVLTAGCAPAPDDRNAADGQLYRYVDTEFGIACYQRFSQGGELDCERIR